jgi:hypothetical protein
MPEATVNENNLPFARKYEVGGAGKVFTMESIAVPKSVSDLTNNGFRLGVLASNLCHEGAACTCNQSIGH